MKIKRLIAGWIGAMMLLASAATCFAGEMPVINDEPPTMFFGVKGYQIILEAKEPLTDAEWDDAGTKLMSRAMKISPEFLVRPEGDRQIVIEVMKVEKPEGYEGDLDSYMEEVAELLCKRNSLEFVTYEEMDKDGEPDFTQPTIWLTEDQVANVSAAAFPDIESGKDEFVLLVSFDAEGTEKMEELTKTHLGKPLYIYYNGELVSNPMMMATITDGSCCIDGFEEERLAGELAAKIAAGCLNLELEVVSVEEIER